MGAAGSGMTSNVAAALAYLLGFITGIIFLVLEPYKSDRFVRFHAFQSIFLSAVLIILNVLWSNIFVAAFLSFGFLWTLFGFVWGLVRLAFFLLWLFLMYKAYRNEKFKVPFIGDLAGKQADR
jgi:uncharacterized membrane protein